MSITVSSSSDAYLLLSEAHYPGWHAVVDGQETSIRRANILFRAVFVPSGVHTVELAYMPTSWPAALLVGAFAWLAVICGTGFAAYHGKGVSDAPKRS